MQKTAIFASYFFPLQVQNIPFSWIAPLNDF